MKRILMLVLMVVCGLGAMYYTKGMHYSQEAARRRFDSYVQRFLQANQRLTDLREQLAEPGRRGRLMVEMDIKQQVRIMRDLAQRIQAENAQFGFAISPEVAAIIAQPEEEKREREEWQESLKVRQQLEQLRNYNYDNILDAIEFYQNEIDILSQYTPALAMRVFGVTDPIRAEIELNGRLAQYTDLLEQLQKVEKLRLEFARLGGDVDTLQTIRWVAPERTPTLVEAQAREERRQAYQSQRAATYPGAAAEAPQHTAEEEEAQLAAAIAASAEDLGEETGGESESEEEWGIG